MLTVALSNYNHARFLPYALEALLAQTRPCDQAIFIDDASTDNSVQIIESYLPRFRDAKLVRNAKNMGVVRNMNRGLEMAAGAVVHFAASDDVTYPTFFAKGMALLEAFPQAALFSARSDILDESGQCHGALETAMPLPQPGFMPPDVVARQLLRDDSWFMGNASLFRRSSLLEAGGFPEELQALTDGYVSRLIALKHGACFTPEVLCAWRRVEGGMAWSEATSLEKTRRTIALAEKKMAEAGDIFPVGYAQLWKGRHLFGSRRFGLIQDRKRARAVGMFAYIRALAREAIMSAWLFARLRPQDLFTMGRRRLAALVERPRGRSR